MTAILTLPDNHGRDLPVGASVDVFGRVNKRGRVYGRAMFHGTVVGCNENGSPRVRVERSFRSWLPVGGIETCPHIFVVRV